MPTLDKMATRALILALFLDLRARSKTPPVFFYINKSDVFRCAYMSAVILAHPKWLSEGEYTRTRAKKYSLNIFLSLYILLVNNLLILN